MEEDAQEGASLLNFKTLEAKRKPLNLTEKKKVTHRKLKINRESDFPKTTLEAKTYWNVKGPHQ